jgi:bacteriorhodopsin
MSALAVWGPRIFLPTFFTGTAISKMTDSVQIAQTISFTILIITAVNYAFRGEWIALIPGIASIAYWNMLSDPVDTEFYRYADWALTTPLMLVAILTAIHSPITTIVGLVVADLIMIWTGYKGIQENHTRYFWAGMLAFAPIVYTLATAKSKKAAIWLTLALWALYPLIWYADEEKWIREETANISYSIMDVIAKVGLVVLLRF